MHLSNCQFFIVQIKGNINAKLMPLLLASCVDDSIDKMSRSLRSQSPSIALIKMVAIG
jgi:hypothetical protein